MFALTVSCCFYISLNLYFLPWLDQVCARAPTRARRSPSSIIEQTKVWRADAMSKYLCNIELICSFIGGSRCGSVIALSHIPCSFLLDDSVVHVYRFLSSEEQSDEEFQQLPVGWFPSSLPAIQQDNNVCWESAWFLSGADVVSLLCFSSVFLFGAVPVHIIWLLEAYLMASSVSYGLYLTYSTRLENGFPTDATMAVRIYSTIWDSCSTLLLMLMKRKRWMRSQVFHDVA